MDNDYDRADHRVGKIVALSLMENVAMLRIHESGMAEQIGRLALFEHALADSKIALIDSQGDGVDGQKYFVDAAFTDAAKETLAGVVDGTVDSIDNLAFITLVGNRLEQSVLDVICSLRQKAGQYGEGCDLGSNDISPGKHSLRISVSPTQGGQVFSDLHRQFIEEA